jgi:formylglycine-generating enzyme required for sulfatase activity
LVFWGQEDPCLFAWHASNALDAENPHKSSLKPTGSLKPNAWSLYDMAGNIAELCHNSFFSYTTGKEKTEKIKMCRGGNIGSHEDECYSSSRSEIILDVVNPVLGFRVVHQDKGHP